MKPITSAVCINQFVSDHLPNNSGNALDAVITALQKEKVLISTGLSKGQKSKKVGYGFTSLKSLFLSHSPTPSRIVEALRTVCTLISGTLESLGIRGHNSLSVQVSQDGDPSVTACLSKNLDGPLTPSDAAVPVTVLPREKNKEDASNVMERIVAIMNDDARRTFTYAITIRGGKMALSRFSRSQVIHSLPFDWTESADILVQVIISLLTATDEQLGYDPFVTMLPDRSYAYQLPSDKEGSTPVFYHSLELISHYPSTCLGDRSPRIWRVKQVVSPTDRRRVAGTSDRVLKDVWVDSWSRTEAEIQEDLFRDISAVVQDRASWRMKPIFQDFLERDVESLAEALKGDRFKQYFSCIVAKYVRQVDDPSTSSNTRRCFFVYESVCTPLHDISTFGEVVDILRQCLIALRLMFCAGWVHRDISTGNILAFRSGPDQPWQVKLSDLEYSTRFPGANLSEDEQIMGTPFFMPCEIQTSRHYFPVEFRMGKQVDYPDMPLVYGYQHDLESIWWIILWFATTRVDQDLCREFGRLHFQQPMSQQCIGRRRGLLRDQTHISSTPSLLDSLPKELLDSNFLDEFEQLKYQIHGEYIMRNAEGKQDDIGTYSYVISESFTLFFEGIEESRALWNDLKLSTSTEQRHEGEREELSQPYHPRRKKRADNGEEGGVRVEPKAAEKRRRKDDRPKEDRPRKRTRVVAPVPEVQAPIRRSGPVTRSMTRAAQNTGPVTRAAARRMRQAAASKNKTTTATTSQSRR
ncbi:other/FunK1 protein kinase [Coprinopsis cinerea AmutBmut pab1-1]|nr:other/FunK1 protein kinase [Coprinopsis cinerea AmutBmut pab1-1]